MGTLRRHTYSFEARSVMLFAALSRRVVTALHTQPSLAPRAERRSDFCPSQYSPQRALQTPSRPGHTPERRKRSRV